MITVILILYFYTYNGNYVASTERFENYNQCQKIGEIIKNKIRANCTYECVPIK